MNKANNIIIEHPHIRFGQAVFNTVDKNFDNIARICQFDYGIDCFYDDNAVSEFLDKCYELYKSLKNY
jgi:hypothetical protein